MKTKAVLVLGGGSALGLAHIGVLSVLEEHYDITGIIGTSMGAIVGGLYSIGLSPREILDKAAWQKNVKVFSPLSLDRHISGIFDGVALLELCRKWTTGLRIEQGKIPFIACAYDLVSRSTVLINRGLYADALRASASLPLIFAPYRWGQYLFVEGGIEHPLPLAFANLLSGDLVIAVNVLPLVEKSARYISQEEATGVKPKRIQRTEVLMQAVFHNQAYMSLKDINSYAPDIVIDAAMSEMNPFALHKAQDLYDYGRKKAYETLANYAEPRFLPQMRHYYRKMMQRVNTIVKISLDGNTQP